MSFLKNKIPPPVITLLIGLLMWAASWHFPIISFNFASLFYFGIAFIGIGLSFDIISFFDFRKNKTTINPLRPEKATHLVIQGFYRFTRNPMYLGMLLVLTGTAMLFSVASAFLFLPVFIVLMNYLQIEPEEIALEKVFGKEYQDYKKKVRRWL